MSEELIQKGLTEKGVRICNYEFYNIGNTTLNQLKKYKIVPNLNYRKYGNKKPDALLVDRRDITNIQVIAVIEHKKPNKFNTIALQRKAIRQCDGMCHALDAKIGIATDSSHFIWFNPHQKNVENNYSDESLETKRSYSIIQDENGSDFIKEFIIDQKMDEINITRLEMKTRLSIQHIQLVLDNISKDNSRILAEVTIDPTHLAKQIWQDVWSVSGATPEKCLYTFLELFIFKYLSDLSVLIEDDKGNKINFRDILSLSPEKAFKNYSQNVRPYLRIMFPESEIDNTTIINGTVLNPDVPEHSHVFFKILNKFDSFGELKNIDPNFKSKVFEEFMKQSISKKNWGQYFTPRNIIDAIIEMSDIEKLTPGSKICDPACGVGGFILEPMKVKKNGVDHYYWIGDGKINQRYEFSGFDKGFEKEEQLTIILAKANMLIFLSKLLKKNPTLSKKFSVLLNSTFKLLSDTILGTLAMNTEEEYDLILSNPPYVTSGSSNYKDAIKNNGRLSDYYKINAMGVEGLFLEWIVKNLKPSGKAFIIIPDGIMNRSHDKKIRQFIKDECIIDGIISLPVNTFYTTSKKTYILCITKKSERNEIKRKEFIQTSPVFTYFVSQIGETLDVKRFATPEKNDLVEMVSLFNQFKGAKNTFINSSKKCKIQPISNFNPESHWSIDRWWSKEEKIEIGVEKRETVLSEDEFLEKIRQLEAYCKKLSTETSIYKLENNENFAIIIPETVENINLSDGRYFELSIGKRLLKKDLFNKDGEIPVYSSNVFEPFGFVNDSNIFDFSKDYILWGIDGNFDFNLMEKGVKFATTDHCGSLKILNNSICSGYILYQLNILKHKYGYDRSLRASLKNMKEITIPIPIDENGQFDIGIQKQIAMKYGQIQVMKGELSDLLSEINEAEIDFIE